jgi:hypothetical protein
MSFPKLSMAIATATLVAYGWFIWWMVNNAGSTDWTRLTYVFGSVSGIVVLAAGIALGSASQQQTVKSTKADAAAVKAESVKLTADAAVGRSLEDVARSLKNPSPVGATPEATSHASRLVGAAMPLPRASQANAEQGSDAVIDFLLEVAATTRSRFDSNQP